MSTVWCNGEIVEGPLALDPRDRGLNLGDGLFETMLVVNRVPLWANMHLARMHSAANELGIPFNRAAVDSGIAAVLLHAGSGHAVLRVTLSRGAGARGLAGSGATPTLLVSCDPFDAGLMFQPAALLTSSIRRSPASPSTRLKTLSYIDNIAAAREAAARAMDDALILNTGDRVACTTIANVFLMKGRKLVTPARDQAILTGVTRQALIAAAQHLGYMVEERAVKPSEIEKADAMFITNSLRFIRPVRSLDQQPVNMADLTPLADFLCDTARLQCGRDPRLI